MDLTIVDIRRLLPEHDEEQFAATHPDLPRPISLTRRLVNCFGPDVGARFPLLGVNMDKIYEHIKTCSNCQKWLQRVNRHSGNVNQYGSKMSDREKASLERSYCGRGGAGW